jgi:Tol biopolymer transport system component
MKRTMKLALGSLLVIALLVIAQVMHTSPLQKERNEGTRDLNRSLTFKLENIQNVTLEEGFVHPVWSPSDSTQLAFSKRGFRGIFLISLNSKQIKQLVDDDSSGFKFIWSQDGSSIVYRTRVDDDNFSIKKVDVQDLRIEELGHPSSDVGLPQETGPGIIKYRDRESDRVIVTSSTIQISRISPFAYQENGQIFITVNGTTRQLTKGDDEYFLPRISPDGRKVLYEGMAGDHLYITDIESGQTISVQGSDGAWSPDSKYIIYELTQDNGYKIVSSDLYIADLTGQVLQLTNTPKIIELRPSWSSAGNLIAFEANGAIYIAEIL